MDEIHVHKTKKSICAHFAESPCILACDGPKLRFFLQPTSCDTCTNSYCRAPINSFIFKQFNYRVDFMFHYRQFYRYSR